MRFLALSAVLATLSGPASAAEPEAPASPPTFGRRGPKPAGYRSLWIDAALERFQEPGATSHGFALGYGGTAADLEHGVGIGNAFGVTAGYGRTPGLRLDAQIAFGVGIPLGPVVLVPLAGVGGDALGLWRGDGRDARFGAYALAGGRAHWRISRDFAVEGGGFVHGVLGHEHEARAGARFIWSMLSVGLGWTRFAGVGNVLSLSVGFGQLY